MDLDAVAARWNFAAAQVVPPEEGLEAPPAVVQGGHLVCGTGVVAVGQTWGVAAGCWMQAAAAVHEEARPVGRQAGLG